MNLELVLFAVVILTAFFLVKSRRQYLTLPELAADPNAEIGDLVVVIPARNEERNIRECVASFAGRVPVCVVDDGSSDRTAEVAREAGATVIPAPPLRKGMAGKPNACMAGAKASESHWILFVDADTRYEPEFLPSLMAEARRSQLDMLSVFLRQQTISLWEKILMPYAFALYFCGVNARNVNSKKSFDALANGQCLLFRRSVYDFMGGHGAVATSIIEDVMLAFIGKRHRINEKVMRAERFGTVRMYEGLGAIWRGFEKNSFRFLLVNRWCGAQVIASSILLTSYIPALALLVWLGNPILAAVLAALPIVLLLPWYRNPLWAVFYPIAIYVFQMIALSAMVTTSLGRGTVWKGRRV